MDVLQDKNFEELKGRRVALITNHTGVDAGGDSTVDILHNSNEVDLVCLLTPEHGFRGQAEAGESVSDGHDAATKLPIYSLYGKTARPTDEMLKDVDTLVFDIQDIGTRFYTYVTTMGMALEAAAKKRLRFVVLDRPNPIRGDTLEGDILDADIKRLTGYFPFPVRHGLTVGEIAHWMNQTQKLHADLVVIKMKKWKRRMWFEQTGLTFIPPSPNIPTLLSAFLYSGVGCFEATNVAVGRGTPTPFEIFGAPWVNGKALCAHLRQFNWPGVLFEPVTFKPEKDIYSGQPCEGVRILVTNRNEVRPFQIFLAAFLFFHDQYPRDFKPNWEEVSVVTGSSLLREAAEGKISYDQLLASYVKNIAVFRNAIAAFYLY